MPPPRTHLASAFADDSPRQAAVSTVTTWNALSFLAESSSSRNAAAGMPAERNAPKFSGINARWRRFAEGGESPPPPPPRGIFGENWGVLFGPGENLGKGWAPP